MSCSHSPIPLSPFLLFRALVRALPGLSGELQQHPFSTPSSLTQWPVSLGPLVSVFLLLCPIHFSLLVHQCTQLP